MPDLEIGYVAGSHPSMDRRLSYLKAAVQRAAEPYQLVPIAGPEFGPYIPIIVDLSVTSPEIEMVVKRLRYMTNRPHHLFIHLSDFFGPSEDVRQILRPKAVRNAHHCKLSVEAFVSSLPKSHSVALTGKQPKPR